MTTAASSTAPPGTCETDFAANPGNAFQGQPGSPSEALLKSVVLDTKARRRLARRAHVRIALEVNARATLRSLAEEVRAPISTVFDDLQAIKKEYRFILLRKSPGAPISLDGLPVGWQRAIQRRQQRHERIITALKHDARAPLTRLSKQLGIPASTLAEDIRAIGERVHFTIEPREESTG